MMSWCFRDIIIRFLAFHAKRNKVYIEPYTYCNIMHVQVIVPKLRIVFFHNTIMRTRRKKKKTTILWYKDSDDVPTGVFVTLAVFLL